MEENISGLYLSRILSGYHLFTHGERVYKLVYPTMRLKYEADFFAQRIYEENKFSEWPTKESVKFLLLGLGIWNQKDELKVKNLEKSIEDTKVSMFNNYLNEKKVKSLRNTLRMYEKEHASMMDKKHAYDHLTIEGYADIIKNEYLLSKSIEDENGDLVFKDSFTSSIDFYSVYSSSRKETISLSDYRKIARGSVWRNYWGANKGYLFDKPIIDWTDEQRTLVMFTRMYDSAHESPDSPDDNIYEDDDMFDGWLIKQRRDREKKKKQSQIESTLPKNMKNSGEVFIMAESAEHAQNIYDLNEDDTRQIIRDREQTIQARQTVEDSNLPDVRRDIIIKSNSLNKKG